MILVATTSSPNLGCALFLPNGELVRYAETLAPQQATEVFMSLVRDILEPDELQALDGFVADRGPGSFAGIRVALTIVKTWGWMFAKPVAGIEAYDLYPDPDGVCIPTRKGEWVERNQFERRKTTTFSGLGYGSSVVNPVYPSVQNFSLTPDQLRWVNAVELNPDYSAEPSISTPKVPFPIWNGDR